MRLLTSVDTQRILFRSSADLDIPLVIEPNTTSSHTPPLKIGQAQISSGEPLVMAAVCVAGGSIALYEPD